MKTKSKVYNAGEKNIMPEGYYCDKNARIIYVFSSYIKKKYNPINKYTWKGRVYEYWSINDKQIYELNNAFLKDLTYKPLKDKNLITGLHRDISGEIKDKLAAAKRLRRLHKSLAK